VSTVASPILIFWFISSTLRIMMISPVNINYF
jgi:hypothetical protein